MFCVFIVGGDWERENGGLEYVMGRCPCLLSASVVRTLLRQAVAFLKASKSSHHLAIPLH
jgi:hypothetical protein